MVAAAVAAECGDNAPFFGDATMHVNGLVQVNQHRVNTYSR